jgi:hypothetical protein
VPSRAFGYDVGGHVYLFNLGSTRLGIGVNIIGVRGTATDGTATMRIVAPQLSFNFGSSDGWSYLSIGAGIGRVDAEATGSSSALNAGGGARWFITRRLGRSLSEVTPAKAGSAFALRATARQPPLAY